MYRVKNIVLITCIIFAPSIHPAASSSNKSTRKEDAFTFLNSLSVNDKANVEDMASSDPVVAHWIEQLNNSSDPTIKHSARACIVALLPNPSKNKEAEDIVSCFKGTSAPIQSPLIQQLLIQLNNITEQNKKLPLEIAQTQHALSSTSLFHAAVLHQLPQLVAKLIQIQNANDRLAIWQAKHIKEPMKNATALHIAAYNGDLETVKILLKGKKTRRNLEDNNDNTALHLLASVFPAGLDLTELATFMINSGCCIKKKNKDNKTPKELANNRSTKTCEVFNNTPDCLCSSCNKKSTSKKGSSFKGRRRSVKKSSSATPASSSSVIKD